MRYLLIGLCVARCLAQSPGNQIYTLSAITGDASLVSRNILFDPASFTLTRDATKYLRLGVKPITVRMVDQFGTNPVIVGSVTTLDLVAGANVILASSQTAPGVLSLQISAPGSCTVDPATGTNTSCTGAFVPGAGLRLTQDNPRQLIVDTTNVSFRSPAIPAGPGPCPIGTNGWSADESGLYYCISNHDATTKDATPSIWAQPHRYSIPDPANPGQWIWAPSLR